MIKKKLINNLIYCCFTLIFTTTLSGCLNLSPKTKEQKVIKLQKKRIRHLTKQLKKKNEQLDRFKAKKWVSGKKRSQASVVEVRTLLGKGQLVEALRKSSQLKKRYPRSKELRKLRVMIFQKMGLKRQAQAEALQLKRMFSNKTRRNRRRM